MARVIGVTVWQEGSFCQCQSLVTWTDLSSSHSYSTCIACHKRQEEFFICPCQFRARPAEYMVHVLDQCASIHVTVYDVPAELLQHCLWHSFCVVHMSIQFVSYSVARGSYILMTVMCMQPLNFLHVHLLRLTPQCVAFV